MVHMVVDAAGPSFDWTADEPPNEQAQEFYNMMKAADEPLWDGCDKEYTVLACVTDLFSIKADCGITNEGFNRIVSAVKKWLPKENAMRLKHGENRNDWPVFDINVWYSSAVDDQNAPGDNYGLSALGQTRAMYRAGGSSSTHLPSSGSYSSAPPASRMRQEDIDMISSHVMASIMPQITASIIPQLTDTITQQIDRAFRATQGGSSSNHASRPDPQDDEATQDLGGDGC